MDSYYSDPYAQPFTPEVYDYTVGEVQKGHHTCLFFDLPNPYCFYLKISLLIAVVAGIFYALVYWYCPMDNKSVLGSLFCGAVAFVEGFVWVVDDIINDINWLRGIL